MASVAIFKSGQTPQYLQSVNTPDYSSDPDALVNPDISGLSGVPIRYWKRVGDTIVEMSASEKQALLDAELVIRKNQADSFGVGMVEIFTALIKVINVRLPAGQKITKQELINAVRAEVN